MSSASDKAKAWLEARHEAIFRAFDADDLAREADSLAALLEACVAEGEAKGRGDALWDAAKRLEARATSERITADRKASAGSRQATSHGHASGVLYEEARIIRALKKGET